MSIPLIANSERERIQLKAQRSRASLSSRHNVTMRALEHLQKGIDEQHTANERTKLEASKRVKAEHSVKTASLKAQHKKDEIELEDAKIALVKGFDVERDAFKLPTDKAALAKGKLEAEGLKHSTLLESLLYKKAIDERVAKKALQQVVAKYEREQEAAAIKLQQAATADTERESNALSEVIERTTREIAEAREKAQEATRVRIKTYEDLVGRHKNEWNIREDALKLQADSRKSDQARLKLEDDFQRQLSDHSHRWEAVKQRHPEEVNAQKKQLTSALAAVQEAYERAEAALSEKRQEVAEWWEHQCNEADEWLLRVDEEESRAIDEMDDLEAAALAEAEATRGGEVEPISAGALGDPQEEKRGEAGLAELVAGATQSASAIAASDLYRGDPNSAESRETASPLSCVASVADNDPTSRFDVTSPSVRIVLADTPEDQAATSSSTPSASADGLGRPHPSTGPVALHAESPDIRSSSVAYAEPNLANAAQQRSSSPDSVGLSDFVEI